jgi:hypothetical protein
MLSTPFFVNCEYESFEEYYKELSSSSKQNYRHIEKIFKNFKYKLLDYETSKNILPLFEEIWSNQIIYNKKASKPNYSKCLSNNRLVFSSSKDNIISALHVVDCKKNYIYCHQPLYDKIKYDELSKFMWFKLIKYVIKNKKYIGIDLGGPCGKISHCNYFCLLGSGRPCNPNTKFIIENRKLLKKYEYKYLYLTKNEKDFKKCKNYIIIDNEIKDIDLLSGIFYVVWHNGGSKNIKNFKNKQDALIELDKIPKKYVSCLYVKVDNCKFPIEIKMNGRPNQYNHYRKIEFDFINWINSFPT